MKIKKIIYFFLLLLLSCKKQQNEPKESLIQKVTENIELEFIKKNNFNYYSYSCYISTFKPNFVTLPNGKEVGIEFDAKLSNQSKVNSISAFGGSLISDNQEMVRFYGIIQKKHLFIGGYFTGKVKEYDSYKSYDFVLQDWFVTLPVKSDGHTLLSLDKEHFLEGEAPRHLNQHERFTDNSE
jgi:hypothetical protein